MTNTKLHVIQTYNYPHNVKNHSTIITSNARQIGIYTHRNSQCYFKDLTGLNTTVGTLIVATIYLQLIQNRYMFRSFTVLQCTHQHCVQPVASDVEVVGYL